MLKRFALHFLHNAVAYLALFVALSGTAYAAAKFTGADIIDETLTGADVRNETLSGADILNGSLAGGDLGIVTGFAANNADDPLPHVAQVMTSTTVTVARTSTLVVFGSSDGIAVCSAPAPGQTVCQTRLGMYLDGNPIPDSGGHGRGLFPGEGNAFDEITLFATVPNVSAGVHTVSLAVGSREGDDVVVGFQGERILATAIPE